VETILNITAIAAFAVITVLASVLATTNRRARAAIITLGVLGIVAASINAYLTKAGTDAAQMERRAIRVKMAEFIKEGLALTRRCANESEPPPTEEADEWAARTESFLRTNLDESYVARFRSSSGLPLWATSINSAPHRKLSTGIHVRLARLNQFLEELSK